MSFASWRGPIVALTGVALGASLQAGAADPGNPGRTGAFGQPVAAAALAMQRGGADLHLSQMNLNGTVSGNVATNDVSGNNTISQGAFAGASGIPMVVQNSGNNVVIQNATIVNMNVK